MGAWMTSFYYSTNHRNFGDALNPYLFEYVLKISVKYSPLKQAFVMGVGSLLQKCIAPRYELLKRTGVFLYPELQVMSSGFISDVSGSYALTRKLDIKALRGLESRKIIESITGTHCNGAVGDGGLLYPLLLKKQPVKKYPVGIIPHYRDQQLPAVKESAGRFNGAVVIDVQGEPLDVLQQIASCERILSSSLHGLIVADALDIPNRHVHFSGNVRGNGFKFKDYYSVFDPEYLLPDLQIAEVMTMSVDALFGQCLSKRQCVAELQENLLKAMKH